MIQCGFKMTVCRRGSCQRHLRKVCKVEVRWGPLMIAPGKPMAITEVFMFFILLPYMDCLENIAGASRSPRLMAPLEAVEMLPYLLASI